MTVAESPDMNAAVDTKSSEGLTSAEAHWRLEQFGPNSRQIIATVQISLLAD
jgi:hypothetical protein